MSGGYQGWGDFRGRGNLLLIVETLVCVSLFTRTLGVSSYGLSWHSVSPFRSLRNPLGWSFLQRSRAGAGQSSSLFYAYL